MSSIFNDFHVSFAIPVFPEVYLVYFYLAPASLDLTSLRAAFALYPFLVVLFASVSCDSRYIALWVDLSYDCPLHLVGGGGSTLGMGSRCCCVFLRSSCMEFLWSLSHQVVLGASFFLGLLPNLFLSFLPLSISSSSAFCFPGCSSVSVYPNGSTSFFSSNLAFVPEVRRPSSGPLWSSDV